MIDIDFFVREFPFLYLLITFGFLITYKIKNRNFRMVGALLTLQLLPIFFVDILLILFFNVKYEEIINQIIFIIVPYIVVMSIFFLYKNKE